MNVKEAARKLSEMYRSSAKGETALSVHLFGIKYADELKELSLTEVLLDSGIPQTYATEVRKGMNLARFVQIKT